jgi:hypothetical protein
MNEDAERLTAYVRRVFKRSKGACWPSVKQAARALGWIQTRVVDAVYDADYLDTESYFTVPEPPIGEHEIYSTDNYTMEYR